MPDISQKMNPRVYEVEIGVRALRTIKIYPLSVKDQFEFTELITQVIAEFFRSKSEDEVDEASIVSLIVDLIQGNLPKLLEYVVEDPSKDDPEDILSDLTNEQLVEICSIIYEVNYGVLGKKVKDLLEKIQNQFSLGRSAATSLDDIREELDLTKSPESHTEAEE